MSLEEVTCYWIKCDRCKKNCFGDGDAYEDEDELIDDADAAGWIEDEGWWSCPKCRTPTEKSVGIDLTGIQHCYGLNDEEILILAGPDSEDKKAMLRDRPILVHAIEDIELERK